MHLERSSNLGVKLQVYNIYKSEPFRGVAWKHLGVICLGDASRTLCVMSWQFNTDNVLENTTGSALVNVQGSPVCSCGPYSLREN